MSYREPPTFDYEPVTRRGATVSERPESEDDFSFSRRLPSPVTAGDELLTPGRRLHQPTAPATPLPATAQANAAPADAPAANQSQHWILRRGHYLSFIGLFLFTVLLYVRPHEMYPTISFFKGLPYLVAAATLAIFLPSQFVAEGNLTTRPREINLILLFSLAVILSVPFALNPAEAWAACTELLKVIVMFIVLVNVTRTELRLKILLFLSLGIGCVVSVGAINDFQSGHFVAAADRIQGIIGGMFENPNDMALHLVMMTPIAIALFFITRNIFARACYVACAVLLIVGNIVTFSRGGLLGLIGVMIIILWKLGRRHRLLVFVLALTFTFSLVVFMPGTMIERLASIINPASDESAGMSAIGRQALLVRSIAVMARHPVLGVGIGNFHTVSIHDKVAHNAYTQFGAEVGVPAMLLYIMFMVTAFKRMSGVERAEEAAESHSLFYYLSVGLQASIVGYMISSFFLSVGHLQYVYYLVGYAIGLQRIYVARPVTKLAAKSDNQTESNEVRGRRWRIPQSKPEAAAS